MFLSAYGGELTKTWVGMMMKNYIRQAGIDRPLSPVHGWRASAASHLMESGLDIRYVQGFLGHRSLQTSARHYLKVEKKALADQMRRFHPKEKRAERKPLVFEGVCE